MITINFNDNGPHDYRSFKEIVQLDNYNDIIYIDCIRNSLSSLPELPNSLNILYCYNNNLSSLPQLPNSLTVLFCDNNNLFSLPNLPNTLIGLSCNNNNLSSLPKLPNSLELLRCPNNSLSSLPELPNSLVTLNYNDNPIYEYIKTYFNGETKTYTEYHNNIKRLFVNKIGNWFLDCKYNPKYLYCRNRLMNEYNELYN